MRIVLCALLLLSACGAESGRSVVVWMSVDGLLPDYVTAEDAPFLHDLMQRSAVTSELVPPFPSLTFPSHATQATGVGVSLHGIPGNSFHDVLTGESFEFPDDSGLLQAEPLWVTAQRQGRRCAVGSWPLSYRQSGPHAAAHFDEKFEKDLTDAARLARLAEVWESDAGAPPLSLVMGYVVGTDSAGHQHGPGSPQVRRQMRETDAALAEFFERSRSIFERRRSAGDRLHVLITTDHGMAPVTTLVNLAKLLGESMPEDARLQSSSTLAHVFLHRLPEDRRADAAARIARALEPHAYVRAYRREDLPATWEFAHATRVGDLVLVLAPGHVFSSKLPKETFTPDEANGVRGMHGYAAEECPEMLGLAIFWSSDADAARDLGRVDSKRLHPTVARLLGIEPAPLATAEPLPIGAASARAASANEAR